MKKIYEGKAKILFEGDLPNTTILRFKNDATAGNGEKKGQIQGKGYLNNLISSYLLEQLKPIVPNHFICRLNDTDQLVKTVSIIRLEVIVRNFAAGSFVKRYGMIYPEYQKFNKPLIEFCLKYDEMGDPFVSEDFLLKLKWLDQESLDLIKSYTLAINDFLVKCFDRKMVHLADAKFEFGRNQHGRIMLADELSPDGMRLWQYKYGGGKFDSLDKDLFRKGLGGETEAYTKIAKMLGLFPEDA